MKLFKIRSNLTQLQKISLAGILIAIIMLLQKVIAVNYIPGLPWVRLSFGGPALIIFSSIFLGPWYGLLIGTASDIFGFFFFDASGFGIMPQITAIYSVLGFASYFIFEAVRNIRNKKVIVLLECLSFAAFLAAITMYLITSSTLETWIKIAFPIGAALLTAGLMAFVFIYNKRFTFELGYNVFQISLFAFLAEVLVLLLFGSLMKAWAFGWGTYLVIFISQTLVTFFNVAMDTVVISLLIKVSKKYMTYKQE